MDRTKSKNRRMLQERNFWAYHNRRKTPQPNGGYEHVCHCGKAVAFCPDCFSAPESDFSISEETLMLD